MCHAQPAIAVVVSTQKHVVAGLSTPVQTVQHQLHLMRGAPHTVRHKSLAHAAVVGLSCFAYLGPAAAFAYKDEMIGAVLFTIVTVAR